MNVIMTIFVLYRSVQTFYSWKCPQGFNILPKNGSLMPKEKCRLCATFCPELAKVYSDTAECSYSIKENFNDQKTDDPLYMKVMKMEGIGKFPYVTVYHSSESPLVATTTLHPNEQAVEFKQNYQNLVQLTVEFGSAPVGGCVEKWITVENPSSVSKQI